MKANRVISIVLTVCAFLAVSAAAQKKPVKYPPKPTVVTSGIGGATATAPAVSDKQKVSNQVMNVTKFIYLLGSIARGIEDADKDKNANKAAKDQNAANKSAFLQTIRNLRAGLAALEVDFRTKPNLTKYLSKIQGITDLSAQAETLATSGRYTDSGRPLVAVVEKLADTLVIMQ